MEIIVLGILVSAWLTYSTAKAYQLHKFSAYIHAALCAQYKTDLWITSCIDINKSYENVMKSPAWDYNFKEKIIYDL